MASIGTLFVEYRATADKFLADLKRMSKDAKEFDRTLKPLREHATNIGSAFSIAGAAITGSLISAAKVTANFGDKLDEASEKTGIAVQELAKLKFAAEQTDSNFEGLAVGLKFLSRNMFEAATGGKEQARVFQALGVETKTATGAIRPANEVLTDLSGIFSKLPDGAEKTALAMKLFGRSGQDLIPFLNAGPEGLKRLGEEAERFGVVMDPVTAKLGDEFNKALDRTKTATLGLSLSIGSVLLPSLTSLINKTNNSIASVTSLAKEFPNATKGALALGAALTAIGGGLLGLAALGTVAPKVAQGLALMSQALAPLTILAAVRSFSDLSTAITLLGQASLTARIGLVALAGGIGIAVGQLINMGVELAGLQPLMDKLILSMSRSLGFNRSIGQTLGNSSVDIKRATDELARRGIVVERGTMTEQQYVGALSKALRAHLGIKEGVKQSGQAVTDYDKMLRDLLASLEKTTSEATKQRTIVDELTKSFISTIRPADELSVKLETLLKRFDEKDIVRAYRDEIIESAMAQRDFGGAIDSTITRLERQALAFKRASDIIRENREGILGTLKPMPVGELPLAPPIVPFENISRNFEALGVALDTVRGETTRVVEANAVMFEAQQKDAAASARMAEKWSRAWSTAVGNISSAFADSVVDTLFSNQKDKTESIEKQITDIKRQQEKERIQAVIDGSRITSVARSNALKQMQAFEERIQAEDQAERDRTLRRLEGELNHQKSLFVRFADSVKKIFADLGKSILKIMITEVFQVIAKSLASTLSGVTSKIGGLFDKIPGLGATGGAVGTATSVAGSAAGSVGNVAGGVAGSLTSGFISGGLAAAGSIVGALITKGNAKRTEENTRESRDWLELMANAWNPLFNQMVFYQKGIYETFRGGVPSTVKSSSSVTNFAPTSGNVTLNVSAPVTIAPEYNFNGTEITPLVVRDIIVPETLLDIELGVRGHGEKLAQIIANKLKGLTGTEAPVGI